MKLEALYNSRVFVSYHRADTEADAGRLVDTLRQHLGDECVFLDVSDVQPGSNWERVVDHALTKSVVLLLVVGPIWKATNSILYELNRAFDSDVMVVPVLFRGADWTTCIGTLPKRLQPLGKTNAITLDHKKWEADTEPLISLLQRMLTDPARAQIAYRTPEPDMVLNSLLSRDNLRSLLVHAADLSECLDDPTILTSAEGMATEASGGKKKTTNGPPSELIAMLGEARRRLLLEQIGRDLLEHSTAEDAARFVLDQDFAARIRSSWEYFEEEKRGWLRNRGDGTEDPRSAQNQAREAEEIARKRLQERLPGLTKEPDVLAGLIELVEGTVRQALSIGRVQNYWEYAMLKGIATYPDLPWTLRDPFAVDQILKRFEGRAKADGI